MAWDVKNKDQKSNKQVEHNKLTYILDFHESRMVHGR